MRRSCEDPLHSGFPTVNSRSISIRGMFISILFKLVKSSASTWQPCTHVCTPKVLKSSYACLLRHYILHIYQVGGRGIVKFRLFIQYKMLLRVNQCDSLSTSSPSSELPRKILVCNVSKGRSTDGCTGNGCTSSGHTPYG